MPMSATVQCQLHTAGIVFGLLSCIQGVSANLAASQIVNFVWYATPHPHNSAPFTRNACAQETPRHYVDGEQLLCNYVLHHRLRGL